MNVLQQIIYNNRILYFSNELILYSETEHFYKMFIINPICDKYFCCVVIQLVFNRPLMYYQ